MQVRPNAPATTRNRAAILDVLKRWLPASGTVLEIGSGTGQHAVFFSQQLPGINWQPSDLQENLDGIRRWAGSEGPVNLRAPLCLDVSQPPDIEVLFDAVFSANTAHIMSRTEVAHMLSLIHDRLRPGGRFLLYGPFRIDGQFTSDSNRQFDRSLRFRDADMGIRDLEWLDELAAAGGLQRIASCAMPANNLMLVWQAADST